jgi:hypothetical protein
MLHFLTSNPYQRPNNPDFKITFQRLLKLAEIDPDLDEDEEDEILNPSEYALSTAKELLTQLDQKLDQNFPRGFSSLESRGGINLIWTNTEFDKEVRIKVPVRPEFSKYLSCFKGDDGKFIKNFSLDQVCCSLIWLQTDSDLSCINF